jgi:hypothetical protein
VGVCGLRESSKYHALKMAKFAPHYLNELAVTTKILELSPGPGSADLALRLGLCSGPTIAAVLRGEETRFQLFEDAVCCMTSNCSFARFAAYFILTCLYCNLEMSGQPHSIE